MADQTRAGRRWFSRRHTAAVDVPTRLRVWCVLWRYETDTCAHQWHLGSIHATEAKATARLAEGGDVLRKVECWAAFDG